MDDLVHAVGVDGMDKSMVSRMAQSLDEDVTAFRTRPLGEAHRYVWLDAIFPKVREGGRVIGMALMIVIGMNDEGQRAVLGVDLGTSENGAGWREFLKALVGRGLHGVQLVTSDDHPGLKAAVRETPVDASWQRCTVQFTSASVAINDRTCHVGPRNLSRLWKGECAPRLELTGAPLLFDVGLNVDDTRTVFDLRSSIVELRSYFAATLTINQAVCWTPLVAPRVALFRMSKLTAT